MKRRVGVEKTGYLLGLLGQGHLVSHNRQTLR